MPAPSGSTLFSAVVAALLVSMSAGSTLAAPFRQPNAGELERAVERLGVVGNVLYVAAHPDDENTRLLAWLRNGKLVRAAYLSLTRGEGGQNLIGGELQPLLGVIRTQELLAARSVDGAEQMFARARDFGYSKTPEETLAIWDRETILADVVWAIRRFQPDVIVTRFAPDGRDTHGHHTASAQLALAAFTLAADPKYHPEWQKWAPPWQARRIVWNRGFFGGVPAGEDLSSFAKLDVGGYNPALGVSYGEMAATSRSMHKSQGFGAAPQRGPVPEYFKLLAGAPMSSGSIFDGVDLSWARVPGSDKLHQLLERVRKEWKSTDPAASIPLLAQAAAALEALPESGPAIGWKAGKRAELADVIAGCAGLFVDASAAESSTPAQGDVKLTLSALNRSHAALTLRSVRLGERTIGVDKPLPANQPWTQSETAHAPERLTNPYWLVDPPSPGHWTVADQTLIGRPEEPAPLTAEFQFTVGDQPFTITRPVAYKWTDPVAGERVRPLEILPALTANPRAPLLMFPDAQPKALKLTVRAAAPGAIKGTIAPIVPAGWSIEPSSLRVELASRGVETELVFHVKPPAKSTDAGALIRFTLALDGQEPAPLHALTRIEYPHIPIETILPATEVKVVRLELHRTRTHLGYIPGAGDDVPAALRQVGYDVTLLDDEALAHESLARFETIVVGVRAFNVNPRLQAVHRRLMDYVAAGGTLLVQYNTKNWLSDVPVIGPYPFTISQTRVTDENATVVTAQDHPILHAPNPLGARDWIGWVQERGLYFAEGWDPAHFVAPLSMHDKDEKPAQGSLIIARHGKGAFIYTGLGFFRQLPAGIPGAYRLFTNLISYGH
jgi:LmbE family N-acetylglucosaminyl deacetylase